MYVLGIPIYDPKVVLIESYGDKYDEDESDKNVRCVAFDGCYIFRVHDFPREELSGGFMFNDEMVTQISIDDEFFFHETLIGNCNNKIKTCPDHATIILVSGRFEK